MPLPTNLTTNEVKDRAGAEVEFQRLETVGRTALFEKVGVVPALPHRISVSHQEIGSGLTARRRSRIRIDKTETGTYAEAPKITTTAYVVLDIPIGNSGNLDSAKDVLAELMSFLATTGAGTTVLFDCTGNGAATLINGSL